MACTPPYCLGTGDYCGCNCKCCPPNPCYTSWTYIYLCGSSISEYPAGCDCTPITSVPAMKNPGPSLGVDFPDFDFPEFKDAEENGTEKKFTFSVGGGGCSIPCSTTVITLTTTGCCLYGSGFSFIAVGAGTVTLSGCGEACEGQFVCSINGQGTSVNVADCDPVSVSISPPSSSCCSCCLVSSSGTLLNPGAALAYSTRDVSTGRRKNFINTRNLIEKMRKAKRWKT